MKKKILMISGIMAVGLLTACHKAETEINDNYIIETETKASTQATELTEAIVDTETEKDIATIIDADSTVIDASASDIIVTEYLNPQWTNAMEDDAQLVARLAYAEAGNQDNVGKRLVIDTVLNRVDDAGFPDTISDVLFQENQYYTYNELMEFPIDENIYWLVREEMQERYNTEVLFFRRSYYHDFGTPLFQYQDHYFSK